MIEVIEANLLNSGHAEALVSLLSQYALDPMGGGKDLPEHVKMHLASEIAKHPGHHVLLATYEENMLDC